MNDGSSDNTINYLREYSNQSRHIRYIDLSRNYGKEMALLAGLDHITGDAAVIIDADLQHPPELIRELIRWWGSGYDYGSSYLL